LGHTFCFYRNGGKQEARMSKSTDLSPWAHPKAKRWFHELIEDNMFALAIDDEISKSEQQKEFDSVRAILAITLLLGRDGIWPENRKTVLRAVARTAAKISKSDAPRESNQPMTVAEHQANAAHDEAIRQELEMLRRRLGMSNRKSALQPPASWGNLWE
jgi:hypothetical protein